MRMEHDQSRVLSLALLVLAACSNEVEADENGAGTDGSGAAATSETDEGGGEDSSSGEGDSSGGGDTSGGSAECAASPTLVKLHDQPPTGPGVVEVLDDGVIVTRGAGRVRGRHELEGTFNTYGERYFENRSYGFTIEDHVASGESRIVITYRPEANVTTHGPGTNLRVWKVYGDGNVFHDNGGLNQVDLRHHEATIDSNAREGRELQVGDVMEFEFGVFIAGFDLADPGAIEGRTSYYTDTFRYRVGEGGLTATNADTSGTLGPAPEHAPGGEATIPYIYAEPDFYFSQMSLNVQPERVQPFLEGRRLFHTDFETGEHSEGGNPIFSEHTGQLGPLFNVASCSSCHTRNGRNLIEADGMPLQTTVVKLYAGGDLGSQLQPQEAQVVRDGYTMTEVEFADGSTLELQQPSYSGLDEDLEPSIRVARRLIGLGLLEAIDEDVILEQAVSEDCDSDTAISGRPSLVEDPETGDTRLGRFGWKAEKMDVRHQIADALDQDMGVSTALIGASDPELGDDELGQLEAYMALLAVPPRRDPMAELVQQGEQVFSGMGCAGCHRPEYVTGSNHPFAELREQTIHPYSDLLLHDMGEGLADVSGGPLARQWRTPPLWGLGLLRDVTGELRLLHDGRARSVQEAIAWHGGEAAPYRDAFLARSAAEREALVAFLESL